MYLVDANVLLYATNSATTQHGSAHRWLDAALSGTEPVGFPWVVLLAYLRLSTKTGIFPRALTIEQALSLVESWLAAPAATIASPTSRHFDVLAGLLTERGLGGNLTTDAHLAALTIEHGASLVSFDRDFGRFSGLRWLVPGGPGDA